MTSNADQNRHAAYTRASVKAKMNEVIGDDVITYQLEEGGEPFYIPHPFFQDKATRAALEAAETDDESARVMLGDQWEAFEAAGGTADDVQMLLANVQLDAKSAMAKGGPTKR